ncbi:MAG: DUF3479 domain-containing protein, partial [Pseudomonadota bacterium]
MMQKPISADRSLPVRVVLVTLDNHLASVADRAIQRLKADIPGLELRFHAAAEWAGNPESLERCKADIAEGDIVIATMIFLEDQVAAIRPALEARRDACDAMVCCLAEGQIVKLTKLGKFDMSKPQKGPMALLKRLRGGKKSKESAGAQQAKMLKRLPQILRFIPGAAQDVRAYFLTLQYWLAGSEDNVANMIRFLVDRYATGAREGLRGTLAPELPMDYPEVGLYHPAIKGHITEDEAALSAPGSGGTVGLLLMRSYLLAGNTAHYDGVIAELEARGLNVVPAFAGGLDARPAVSKYFTRDGHATVDAVVSLTGFSLVGGPAYNDAKAAEDMLADLDVPYLAAHAIEFQTLESWHGSGQGLMPVESTIMVAIPELDGATGPMVFGGRSEAPLGSTSNPLDQRHDTRDMICFSERAQMLAARV